MFREERRFPAIRRQEITDQLDDIEKTDPIPQQDRRWSQVYGDRDQRV